MRLEAVAVVLAALLSGAQSRVGYKRFPGVGSYRMHLGRRSWDDARSQCEAEDAHLLVVDSEHEFLVVRGYVERYGEPGAHYHAGFHDRFDDGHFIDIFGKPIVTAGYNVPWEGRQVPAAQEDRNCGAFGGFDNPLGGGYSVQSCFALLRYVCERDHRAYRGITYPFRKILRRISKTLFD